MTIQFDGNSKLIAITTTTNINWHDDVYVPAMNWISLSTNMKYLSPIKGEGKSIITTGIYTDSIYTILNGWKLQFNGYSSGQIVVINGTITNGQSSIVAPSVGNNPIITFAGYTNATIVESGGGTSNPSTIATAVWTKYEDGTYGQNISTLKESDILRIGIIANQT